MPMWGRSLTPPRGRARGTAGLPWDQVHRHAVV